VKSSSHVYPHPDSYRDPKGGFSSQDYLLSRQVGIVGDPSTGCFKRRTS
jgi:hypothetical protein